MCGYGGLAAILLCLWVVTTLDTKTTPAAFAQVAAKRADEQAGRDPGACKAGGSGLAFELKRYNANITTAPNPAKVRTGDVVEFNAEAVGNHVSYLRAVSRRGGLPEWYWVGANCYKGRDCDRLHAQGVPLGSTGTAEWNRSESRIDDLAHPAVVRRAEAEMERALRAAGAAESSLAFRIDNMHNLEKDAPDAKQFYDRRHVRAFKELSSMTQAWDRVVARLRGQGVLKPGALVGLTAHNNFKFWTQHVSEGGTRPLLLRMENPTQFAKEFGTGLHLMRTSGIPFVAIEFREGHGYQPTPEALDAVAAQVSVLVLMENEDNYEDGEARFGPGPRTITACRGP